jgi:hypothetical protein
MSSHAEHRGEAYQQAFILATTGLLDGDLRSALPGKNAAVSVFAEMTRLS